MGKDLKFRNFLSVYIYVVMIMTMTCSVTPAESLKFATIQLPPFGYIENDRNDGIFFELSNEIAKAAGYECKNVILPYARVIKEIEMGEIDCTIILPNEAMDAHAVRVSAIMTLENIIFGMKGLQIDSLASLHGKMVATVRGAEYSDSFSQDDQIEKVLTDSYEQSIKILVNHRVDAIIGPKTGLFYTLKKMGLSTDRFSRPYVVNTKETYFHLSKRKATESMISSFQTAIDKLKKEGVIDRIYDKFVMAQ